jgi:dipeptidyl aminopeptidase/acylaminoacyl peptidase
MRMGGGTTRAGLACAWVALAAAPAESAWKWTPEAVVDTVAVTGAAVSPDGSSVAFSRSRWRPAGAKPGPAYANLWRVPFTGGEPQRLTTADAEDQRARFSPDGSMLAFLSKRGGEGAKTRIWTLATAGGEPEPLSDEKTEVSSFEWSPDGGKIAYVAVGAKGEEREKAEKEGKDAVVVDGDLRPRRLWILDAASKKAEKLASLGEWSAWDFDWAPDSSALVASVTEKNRTDDSYMLKRIVTLPLRGERREIVPVVGKVGELAWSKDGKTIAYLAGVDSSDPAAGSVFVVPAAGGAPRNLTGSREETAQAIAWRHDGSLAVTSVVGAKTALYLVDPDTGKWERAIAPGLVAFTSVSFSSDGTRFALVGSTSAHAPDVYAGGLPAPAKEGRSAPTPPLKRLVNSNPSLDGLPRGAQETIRYRAEDGLEIEAVLIKPVGFREGTRYPLVVVAHGGPESQYLDGWQNGYAGPGHALAERGYMVLFPNYRGSTGRGVAYAKADHKDLGGKEFTDVLDGIDHLAAKRWIDPRRVGITGGSYGGYFTALGITRYSDRFAAGVELFGITNWESFLGQSDIPLENSLVHWALWCYDHAALCRERSPIGNIHRARTPTLILQGQEDLRVPKAQSDELYAALRFKQVPVEYVVYPREAHGFRERWHRIDAVSRLVEWMDRYLKGGS